VHKPFADRQCGICHNPPNSPEPFKTVSSVLDLCLNCHAKVGEDLKKVNLHLPGGERACVECHNPHNSSFKRLLVKKIPTVCWKCHKDTVWHYQKMGSKHEPNEAGQCIACHNPHGSDELLLLTKSPISLCGECHEWMVHVSHPMEKAVDPRTKLNIDCLSCHNPHGTQSEKLLHAAQERALCIQCHKEQL
jgi:predicted CXXCH cytochrome family protein